MENLLVTHAVRNIQRRFLERYDESSPAPGRFADSSRTPYTFETHRIA